MGISTIAAAKLLDLAFMAIEVGVNAAMVKKETKQMAADGQPLDAISKYLEDQIVIAKREAKSAISKKKAGSIIGGRSADPAPESGD